MESWEFRLHVRENLTANQTHIKYETDHQAIFWYILHFHVSHLWGQIYMEDSACSQIVLTNMVTQLQFCKAFLTAKDAYKKVIIFYLLEHNWTKLDEMRRHWEMSKCYCRWVFRFCFNSSDKTDVEPILWCVILYFPNMADNRNNKENKL